MKKLYFSFVIIFMFNLDVQKFYIFKVNIHHKSLVCMCSFSFMILHNLKLLNFCFSRNKLFKVSAIKQEG